MSHLEPQLVALISAAIILLGTINVWFLNRIKQETSQVNNAVNHVGPNKRPLTERVDRIDETLVVMQYEQAQAKHAAIESKTAIEKFGSVIEQLMISHVKTNEKLEEIIKTMPKRKNDSH